ncbi:MAG: glutathione-disulfide reductase [Gloeomargaritaceae cyanobacterium C42_A2020_066]|nr:glutathione-disulfide reductase [Gloeomargaritaceae cyanobacterium C42_A2020_066]
MTFDYDLFVIGAGSGGVAAARRAASYGARVGIAEREQVGGTCVVRGCVPKKLLVYASKFAAHHRESQGYGWRGETPHHDWSALVTAVQAEVNRLSQVYINLLAKSGVELLLGSACFVDAHTLRVGERQVTAEKVLIAVGGEAVRPAVPGIELALTSRQMFTLPGRPATLAVVGGGYIGVEFAGIMHGLGCQVTQIVRGDGPLREFDADLRAQVQAGMVAHGITFLTGTQVVALDQVPEGIRLQLAGETTRTLTVEAVLYATGRAPNLQDLGLEQAGVTVVEGFIPVDARRRTSQPHIFALGDCIQGPHLTPVAIAEGRAFADREWGGQTRWVSQAFVPTAIFSQPEAATVGLTEAQARAQYGERVQVYRTDFRPMYHTLTREPERCLIKLVVNGATDRVVGVHLVGDHAAELIQPLAVALTAGTTKADFDRTIAVHPTIAEELVLLR